MIYAVTYALDCVTGAAGYVDTDLQAVLEHAVHMARIGLAQIADGASAMEWCDADGVPADPSALLDSSDDDQRMEIVRQISDALKTQYNGYVDLWKYPDVLALIQDQCVEEWCSVGLKQEIAAFRAAQGSLIQRLCSEWLS